MIFQGKRYLWEEKMCGWCSLMIWFKSEAQSLYITLLPTRCCCSTSANKTLWKTPGKTAFSQGELAGCARQTLLLTTMQLFGHWGRPKVRACARYRAGQKQVEELQNSFQSSRGWHKRTGPRANRWSPQSLLLMRLARLWAETARIWRRSSQNNARQRFWAR